MARPGLHDYSRLVPYPIQKKLLSALDGRHQGEGAGVSHEFLDLAEYTPGDDVATIDWKATARVGEPVVRRFESTAVLRVVLAVDTGSAMAATAPGGESKTAITEEIVAALAWLVAAHGDLLGLAAGNGEGVRTLPARSGAGHAETVLRVAGGAKTEVGRPDFAAVLRRVEGAQRRSLIFAITDESQVTARTVASLRRLSSRHEVGVFLVSDLDPTTHAARNALIDVDGGPLPDFLEAHPTIRAQWAHQRRLRSQEVDRLLAAAPLRYARVDSRADVLDALVQVVGGGRSGT